MIELKDKSIEQCLNEPLDYMENMDVVIEIGIVFKGAPKPIPPELAVWPEVFTSQKLPTTLPLLLLPTSPPT